ncbi:DUF3239 domain-containing protein [Saccharomonospora sp. NPDC046836]|uniref:DUF3239 domain-containing protein n=1 Tax=Saccharomonospora sp. NPDC046836 TaxID=3156921 RepID=UPI0033C96A34
MIAPLPPSDPRRYQRWAVDERWMKQASGVYQDWLAGVRLAMVIGLVLAGLGAWALTAGAWWGIALGVLAFLGVVFVVLSLVAGRGEAREPFAAAGGPVLPGIVVGVADDKVTMLALADLSRTHAVPPSFAVAALEFSPGKRVRWQRGQRIACIGYGFDSSEPDRQTRFRAAPVSWASADADTRRLEALIEPAEWELLASLVPRAAKITGASGKIVHINPASLPPALRFPASRFGDPVIWDPAGNAHPVAREMNVPEAATRPAPPPADGNAFVGVGPVRRGGVASRHLYFEVDREHAKQYNELHRSDRRFMLAPALLGLLALGGAAWLATIGTVWSIVLACVLGLAGIGLAGLWLWLRSPNMVGDAATFFGRGLLNPAMIADVRPDGATVMVLAEMTRLPGAPIRYALVTRDVRALPGHRPVVGERVPVTCSFSIHRRQAQSRVGYWDELNPVPLAWGTPDQNVLRSGIAAIPEIEWEFLARNLPRHRLVSAAPSRLVLLGHAELPGQLREPASPA